jgi:hypothetical protein
LQKENALVVDAWAGSVYTKKEFSNVNKKLYYYGISNNITGVSQHIIKYVGSGAKMTGKDYFLNGSVALMG